MKQISVVGEDQQPFSFKIEAPGWKNPSIDNPFWQHIHDRQSIMSVVGAGDGSCSLVKHDGQGFGWLDLFAVENDFISARLNADAERGDLAIDVDESFFDQELRSAAGSVATTGQILLESFTSHGIDRA